MNFLKCQLPFSTVKIAERNYCSPLVTSFDIRALRVHKLGYMKETPQQPRRNKQRNIVWFNTPFSNSVKTNIGRNFLCVIDKHCPLNHGQSIQGNCRNKMNTNNIKHYIGLTANTLKSDTETKLDN